MGIGWDWSEDREKKTKRGLGWEWMDDDKPVEKKVSKVTKVINGKRYVEVVE